MLRVCRFYLYSDCNDRHVLHIIKCKFYRVWIYVFNITHLLTRNVSACQFLHIRFANEFGNINKEVQKKRNILDSTQLRVGFNVIIPTQFIINVETFVDNLTSRHRFDNVIIATDHFTSQVTPHIKGLVSFNGPVLHSYHFHDPELYKGKRMLVVGLGESAEDVCWYWSLICHS